MPVQKLDRSVPTGFEFLRSVEHVRSPNFTVSRECYHRRTEQLLPTYHVAPDQPSRYSTKRTGNRIRLCLLSLVTHVADRRRLYDRREHRHRLIKNFEVRTLHVLKHTQRCVSNCTLSELNIEQLAHSQRYTSVAYTAHRWPVLPLISTYRWSMSWDMMSLGAKALYIVHKFFS